MGARIVQRAFVVVYLSVRAQHVCGTCASWWDVGRNVFVLCAFGEMCGVGIFFGGGRIVQRAFVVCLLECARSTCVARVRLGGMGEGSFCFVRVWRNVRRGDFFGGALFSARLSFVSRGVRARHVRGTCASWWIWGGKFLFCARLEKCAAWEFFWGTHCSTRVCRLFLGACARSTCVTRVRLGGMWGGKFLFRARFGEMCDVRIFFGGGTHCSARVYRCFLERARAARAWHVCVLVDVGREVFVSCAFGGMCGVGIFLGGRIVQRAFVVCLFERARAACAGVYCFRGGSDVF